MKETGVDKQIWDELQRQLDAKGFEIKKGIIQDAAFIEADLGKKRYSKEKKAKKKKVKPSSIQRNNCSIWIRMDHFL